MSNPRKISLAKLEALEVHPFAMLFPFASDAEIEGIATRMAEKGFREDRPIVLHEGRILDGRNRRKSLALAVAIKGKPISGWCQNYDGPLDPLEFVLSENLDRRHLNESQRAIVAANLANWSRGMNATNTEGAHVHTRQEAAKILNVSKRSISYAKNIIARSDLLADAVSAGTLKVRTAAELIELGDKELADTLILERREIVAKAKEIRTENKSASRMDRVEKLNQIATQGSSQTTTLPRNKFAVLYCDAPWENEVYSKATGDEKSPPYPTMALDEIKQLCAGENSPAIADAVLFFWTTGNRIGIAIDVIRAWGFEDVSSYAWGKEGKTDGMGLGRWVRDCHETLIIAKRGDIHAPDATLLERSLHWERKTKHSQKPDFFARIIDRQYPDIAKLELFQRKSSLVKGDIRLHTREKGCWSFWGLEAGRAHLATSDSASENEAGA